MLELLCIGNLPFGYVAAFRSHVNVGFYFGAALDDPHRLLTGTGRFMRHVKIQPSALPPENLLEELGATAYADARARIAAGSAQGAANNSLKPTRLRGAAKFRC